MQYVSSSFHWWISKNNIKSKQIQTVRHNPDKDSCYSFYLQETLLCFTVNGIFKESKWKCRPKKPKISVVPCNKMEIYYSDQKTESIVKRKLNWSKRVLLRETARGVPPERNLSEHNQWEGGGCTPCPVWGNPCPRLGYPPPEGTWDQWYVSSHPLGKLRSVIGVPAPRRDLGPVSGGTPTPPVDWQTNRKYNLPSHFVRGR